MKRIVLAALVLAAAAGTAYKAYPAEFVRYAGQAEVVGLRAWDGVRDNPAPVAFALGTFLVTVLYHTAKGKSLRESVEVAATRVAVVPVPAHAAENPVVTRAKARATRAQLLADQVGLQNRQRKLVEDVNKAEKDACYTEQAVVDAAKVLAEKRKLHDTAVAKLETLGKEQADGAADLAAIDAELKKLAGVV
jgi:hypothetical protein